LIYSIAPHFTDEETHDEAKSCHMADKVAELGLKFSLSPKVQILNYYTGFKGRVHGNLS
jgi:hypothetical protein